MPARREPLDQPALDVEQARLVVLDHVLGHDAGCARARPSRDGAARPSGRCVTSMRSTSTRVATFQNTRVCHGPSRCDRPAVEADDGELVGLGLDRLEQLRGEIGPRRLEHGVALGRELGAHDRVELDRELAQRIDQAVAARLEHPLEPAVAREEGALAVLHRHAQHQQVPVHGTLSFIGRAATPQAGLAASRMWVPDASSREERRAGA